MHTIDPFGGGLLLGLIIGMCLFASARIAVGVIGSCGAGILPFVLTNGLDAFGRMLFEILKTLESDALLTSGILLGLAIVGIMSVVFRRFATWK
jgi:hypothetical protein